MMSNDADKLREILKSGYNKRLWDMGTVAESGCL